MGGFVDLFVGVLVGIIMIPIGLLVWMVDTWMKSDDYESYKREKEDE